MAGSGRSSVSTNIAEIITRMRALEAELETELKADLQRKAEQFRYRVEQDRIRFEKGAQDLNRRARQGIMRFVLDADVRSLVAAPFIYSMIVPLILLDFSLFLYQQTCFRICGIARADRSVYIVLDRHHLGYLNWIEKLNCAYCSYANGLVAFAREIGSRTEQYWCPINHARRVLGSHARYRDFLAYGDAEAWRRDLPALRAAVRDAGE